MKSNKYDDMYQVLIDLDDSVVELDDIQNLLTVFSDLFEDETEGIRTNPGYTSADVLAARLPLLISTLNVIRFRLTDVLSEANYCIRQGFALIGINTEKDSGGVTA